MNGQQRKTLQDHKVRRRSAEEHQLFELLSLQATADVR